MVFNFATYAVFLLDRSAAWPVMELVVLLAVIGGAAAVICALRRAGVLRARNP